MQHGLFHSSLSQFLQHNGLDLQEVIYGSASPAALEKKWLDTFSEKKFNELGLLPHYPRMLRGLPRLYHADDPTQCRLKKEFSHFPDLKRCGAERAFLSLFEKVEVKKGARVSVFTYVMGDGWGDLLAGSEVCSILRDRFPDLDLRFIALLSEKKTPPELNLDLITFWKGEELNGEALGALRSSDLILQIPTHYPKLDEIKEKLKKITLSLPMPTWIEVGEYGYIESDWFHPRSGRFCLGLHCLENGILIRKSKQTSFFDLKNGLLLQAFFATSLPGPQELEKYKRENAFYLAYLSSSSGGLAYLQALVKLHEGDEKRIDLVSPDIGWLIRLIQEGRWTEILGLHELEIHYEGKEYLARNGVSGKRIRILSPGILSHEDFKTLLQLSSEFIAVRGDQSLSEAISAGKVFFYDGRAHKYNLMRDLAALAENRIGFHRNSLTLFRSMRKAFLHQVPLAEGGLVEEDHFQERESLIQLGIQMGMALMDPDAIVGFKKYCRIISEEYNGNSFLIHLIQKELLFRSRPDLAKAYEETVTCFLSNEIDFGACYTQLASHLHLEKNNPIWKMKSMRPDESHNLNERLGKALRELISTIAKDELALRAKEIVELSLAIGGSLQHEAKTLEKQLKSLIEISKQVTDSAFHLEQETREI